MRPGYYCYHLYQLLLSPVFKITPSSNEGEFLTSSWASCVVTYDCYPKAHRAAFHVLNVCLPQFDPPRCYTNRAPFPGRKTSGTARSLETIQFDLWFLLRYILHHVLFLASYINQKPIPLIKQLPGAQAFGMQRRKRGDDKHQKGRLHVSRFKPPSGLFISRWPSRGMELSCLGNKTWSHDPVTEWVLCPSLAVFAELLMSLTFARSAQSLEFLQLTFASWNPSVKLTHSPGKFISRHIHISRKSNFKQVHAHACSEDEDI